MLPRPRDLVYPVVYLFSFVLLFVSALGYLAVQRPGPNVMATAAVAPRAATSDTTVAAPGPRLELERTSFVAGTPDAIRVRVFGADGRPADLAESDHRRVRLSVVRRDLSEFLPLRAIPEGAGRWSAPLTLPAPGPYRLIVEVPFEPDGQPLLLGADLTAPGAYRATRLEPPAAESSSWPYAVRMDGHARAGEPSRLSFTVHEGEASTTASAAREFGNAHVTALRLGDLTPARAALALEDGATEPTLFLDLLCSRPGTYRLFLTFDAADEPHTADFTLAIPA